jgi:hypothetical protein
MASLHGGPTPCIQPIKKVLLLFLNKKHAKKKKKKSNKINMCVCVLGHDLENNFHALQKHLK